MKQPRKLIYPDHYGLFYQVARSLHHSQSRGFDSGESAVYQLLLFRSTAGATQGHNFKSHLLREVCNA
jgi:hypothetical protein